MSDLIFFPQKNHIGILKISLKLLKFIFTKIQIYPGSQPGYKNCTKLNRILGVLQGVFKRVFKGYLEGDLKGDFKGDL